MAAGDQRLSLILDSVDRSLAGVRSFNRRMETTLAPLRKVKNSLRALSRETGLPKLRAAIGGVGKQIARFAAVGAAGLAAVTAAVVKVSERGDEIAKFARQVGIGAEALQEYEFAAERAGVSQDTFRNSIGALSKRVGELQRGGGALKTFEKFLPNVIADLRESKDAGEALKIVNDAISRIEDPTKKAALAAAAFSRAGLPMIRLADEGSDGIAKLTQRARDLGLVLSADAVAGAEGVQDSITDMKRTVSGLVASISVDLFPIVREIADGVTQWVQANRALIRTRAREAIDGLVAAGRSFLAFAQDAIPRVMAFVENLGGLRTIAIVVGGILAATVIPGIVAFGVALGPLGIAVAATIAGYTALAAAISANWDSIKSAVASSVDFVLEKMRALVQKVPAPVRRLLGLEGGGSSTSVSIASSVVGAISPGAGAVANTLGAAAQVGGRIAVEVLDGRTRIRSVESTNPAVPLDFEGGQALTAG